VTKPEPAVINAILEAFQLHPAETITQYIPKLWSHMVMFGYLNMENLLENILHLISVHCKPASDSALNAQFAEIAVTIWDHIQVIEISFNMQNVLRFNFTINSLIIRNLFLQMSQHFEYFRETSRQQNYN